MVGATSLMAAPAVAQTQDEPAQIDEVIVTGSRIARKDYAANSPIVTVTQEDFQATGSINIETLINDLPQFTPAANAASNNPNSGGQANVQLRGLGTVRTLVLLNGRRVVPSNASSVVDLNLLPTPLISSIETITGGASSTYGSDAVAGVLNFLVNDKFEGVQLDLQYGQSSRNDAATTAVSLTMGGPIADGRGRAALSLSYSERDSVFNAARRSPSISGFAGTSPLGSTVFDATNLPSAAAITAAIPGAARGNTFGFNNNGTLFAYQGARDYISPGGIDYEGFRMPGPLQQTDFTYNTGPQNYLIIPQTRYNIYGAASYEINSAIKAYADFMFSQYESGNLLAPNPATGPTTGFRVPSTNPFISAELRGVLNSRPDPTGSFRLDKRFNILGPRQQTENYSVFQVTTGLRCDLKGLGDWTYDAYFSYGRVDDGTTYTGYLSRSATQRLLDASDGGNSLCAGGFNPFGETKLSASCINYISRIAKNTTVNDQRVFEANVQGGVFDLPAGQVRLALGGTYREQNYKLVPDALLLATFTLNGVTGPELAGNSAQPLAGSDSVYEGYGEILIPLLRDLPFVHRLETNLGYRVSKYDSIGGVQSYKADASWEIVERLRVRGGIQRAVRAPSIGELFGPQNLSFPSIGVPVSSTGARQFSGDPCDVRGSYRAPGATGAASVRNLCLAQNVPGQVIDGFTFSNSQVSGLTGGNPNLTEEKSKTYTIGAVISPPFIPRLNITVDYFNVEVKGAITTINAQQTLNDCYTGLNANSPTCRSVFRLSSGQIDYVRTNQNNIGALKVRGLDVQGDYTIPLPAALGDDAQLRLTGVASWLFERSTQVLSTVAPQDCAGFYGAGCSTGTGGFVVPDFKLNLGAAYTSGPLSIRGQARMIGGLKVFPTVTTTNIKTAPATWYFDLTSTFEINDNFTFFAGVDNLLDKMPPILGTTFVGDANVDVSLYDTLGRRYFAGVRMKF